MHAARQRRDAVVRQRVAIQRIGRRVVDVRLSTPSRRLSSTRTGACRRADERPVVELAQTGRSKARERQTDLRRVAQRQDKQPSASMLATVGRVPSGRCRNRPGLLRPAASMIPTPRPELSAAHCRTKRCTWVAGRKAVLVDQVLPDRAGVTAAANGSRWLAIGLQALAVGDRGGGGCGGHSAGEMAGFACRFGRTGGASTRGPPPAPHDDTRPRDSH